MQLPVKSPLGTCWKLEPFCFRWKKVCPLAFRNQGLASTWAESSVPGFRDVHWSLFARETRLLSPTGRAAGELHTDIGFCRGSGMSGVYHFVHISSLSFLWVLDSSLSAWSYLWIFYLVDPRKYHGNLNWHGIIFITLVTQRSLQGVGQEISHWWDSFRNC